MIDSSTIAAMPFIARGIACCAKTPEARRNITRTQMTFISGGHSRREQNQVKRAGGKGVEFDTRNSGNKASKLSPPDF
jgi:hypothetical protein